MNNQICVFLILSFSFFLTCTYGQNNVGIGIVAPAGKLHIKGAADVSQLIVDAHSTQANTNPLIKLRNSSGTDLMWIHSDSPLNTFIGLNAGRVNNSNSGGNYNTLIGRDAGYSNTVGVANTANGYQALYSNTTGDNNDAYGYQALYSNTTGDVNVATGLGSLFSNTIGSSNIASGMYSLNSNVAGNNGVAIGYHSQRFVNNNAISWDNTNTSLGYQSLRGSITPANNTGSENTAIGREVLFSNTTGDDNTASGFQTLYSNTQGDHNSAYGTRALYSNTIGNYNDAVGKEALYSNTYGSLNAAFGHQALSSNTTGNYNIAIGSGALRYNTTGLSNTSMGYETLIGNQTGNENTAMGYQSLYFNKAGSNATVIGTYAMLYSNNTTVPFINYNVAVGYEALRGTFPAEDITGNHNTGIGYQTLAAYTSGSGNSAVGKSALTNNTTGNNNVALGFDAGGNQTTGSNCTFLGYSAEANTGTYTNAMAIGYQATVNGSNKIRIGNSSITEIGGYEPWTDLSDSRFKKNISENVHGLDFIMKLRPVTYNLEVNKLAAHLKEDEYPDTIGTRVHVAPDVLTQESRDAKENILYTGFVAQDVEVAAKSIGYDFSGVSVPKNDEDLYGLRYAEFVVPLVKAVQELSVENGQLRKTIGDLQSAIQQEVASKNNVQDKIIEQLKKDNEGLIQRILRVESLLEKK